MYLFVLGIQEITCPEYSIVKYDKIITFKSPLKELIIKIFIVNILWFTFKFKLNVYFIETKLPCASFNFKTWAHFAAQVISKF